MSRETGTSRAASAASAERQPGMTEFASRVLDVAESIPPGRVMSYGDIAECLGMGGGPRQVGQVMSLWGGGVPWWRVVHSDGRFLDGHEHLALAEYRAEGTPLRTDAAGRPSKLDMRKARWPGPGRSDDPPGSTRAG